ncbi:MAG TPA: hypothetical protein VMT03_02380 [Polyangia bacterium]|nr:hypothetical protein [Polyangia bacterium]
MLRRTIIHLSAISLATVGCGGKLANPPASDTPANTADDASTSAPADPRCDGTPRMLANARSLQIAGNASPVSARLGNIAVKGAAVYYTVWGTSLPDGSTGALMQVPVTGGASTVVATGNIGQFVTTDSLAVFAAPDDTGMEVSIATVPLAGGAPATVATIPGSTTYGLSADDDFIYLAARDEVSAIPLHPAAGSDAFILITKDIPPNQSPEGLGLFGNQLIFGLTQGGIESVPLPPRTNSPVTTLGAGSDGGLAVLPCGPSSCWVGWGGVGLEEIDSTGNVLSTLSTGSLRWGAVASDGTTFYLVGNGALLYGDLVPGFLARVAPSNGAVTTVGSMEEALDVAVDDECVYWASESGVFSLSKSATQTFALDGVPPPAAADAGTTLGPATDGGADAGSCVFEASNYDRSCQLDGDCVAVHSADYCSNTACGCGGDPVSVAGRAQFNADISKTPLGSGALQWPPCSCPVPAPICCRAGMCTHDCLTPPDGGN